MLLGMLVSLSVFAQKEPSALSELAFGTGKIAPTQLSIDVYPFLFLSSGGGGSIGVEFGNWQIGAIGFSTVPPEFIKTNFFRNAETVGIRRNSAAEIYASYYLRKDRKGIYAGMLGGPEWFVMEDKLSGQKQTIVKSYVVPRLGIRVFPFRETFYADASFGYSFNISDTDTQTVGRSNYNASSGGIIYFLQVGARFNIARN